MCHYFCLVRKKNFTRNKKLKKHFLHFLKTRKFICVKRLGSGSKFEKISGSGSSYNVFRSTTLTSLGYICSFSYKKKLLKKLYFCKIILNFFFFFKIVSKTLDPDPNWANFMIRIQILYSVFGSTKLPTWRPAAPWGPLPGRWPSASPPPSAPAPPPAPPAVQHQDPLHTIPPNQTSVGDPYPNWVHTDKIRIN